MGTLGSCTLMGEGAERGGVFAGGTGRMFMAGPVTAGRRTGKALTRGPAVVVLMIVMVAPGNHKTLSHINQHHGVFFTLCGDGPR